MARKGITQDTLTDVQSGISKSILQGMADLYFKHADAIEKIVKESDGNTATITFPVKIDRSQSVPIVDVGIRFTDTTTDHRKFSLQDPAQPELFVAKTDSESGSGKQKRDGKKAASGESDNSGEGSVE